MDAPKIRSEWVGFKDFLPNLSRQNGPLLNRRLLQLKDLIIYNSLNEAIAWEKFHERLPSRTTTISRLYLRGQVHSLSIGYSIPSERQAFYMLYIKYLEHLRLVSIRDTRFYIS